MSHAKKNQLGILIAIIAVIGVTGLAVMYGQGQLNLGAVGVQPKKAAKVALTECPAGSKSQDKYCIFTLEPMEYYVIKDGDKFVIHGPKLTEIFTKNQWNFSEGTTMKGDAYSVVKFAFTMMELTFKPMERGGSIVPSFVFDRPTAEKIQGSRFVEVELQGSIKLRFNTFNIPDRDLNNQ